MQHGSNTVLWFCVVLVVLGDEMKERDNLVQFSKGERVSVTSLFLKERVSNFCFLASGSSSLSFLSCPRSATGDRVSVTVLFLVSVTFKSILNLFLPVPQLQGVVLLFVCLPIWSRSVFLVLVLTKIRHGGERLSHRPGNIVSFC